MLPGPGPVSTRLFLQAVRLPRRGSVKHLPLTWEGRGWGELEERRVEEENRERQRGQEREREERRGEPLVRLHHAQWWRVNANQCESCLYHDQHLGYQSQTAWTSSSQKLVITESTSTCTIKISIDTDIKININMPSERCNPLTLPITGRGGPETNSSCCLKTGGAGDESQVMRRLH